MVRKASELYLPWQGSRPRNDKQAPFPQLSHDWPYPGTLVSLASNPATAAQPSRFLLPFSLDPGSQSSYAENLEPGLDPQELLWCHHPLTNIPRVSIQGGSGSCHFVLPLPSGGLGLPACAALSSFSCCLGGWESSGYL